MHLKFAHHQLNKLQNPNFLSYFSTMAFYQLRTSSSKLFPALSIFIFLLPNLVLSERTCGNNNEAEEDDHSVGSSEATKYKLIAIASTLVASTVGISLPILAKNLSYLNPESGLYFLVKAFAAAVILATAFLHVLPEAFEALEKKPWGNKFPLSGFVAIVTLIMEALITGYHKRRELMKAQPLRKDNDEESNTYGLGSERLEPSNNLRHSLVSQILELPIVIHSMIVGISLGASRSPNTIKPLVAALCFHQCFEGMGLGSCISQAQFKRHTIVIMVLFFCLTIPIGTGVGAGTSISAGILIFMALVDLLANDFIMNSKMLNRFKLQLGASSALLIGLICMSILVMWGE